MKEAISSIITRGRSARGMMFVEMEGSCVKRDENSGESKFSDVVGERREGNVVRVEGGVVKGWCGRCDRGDMQC